MNRRSRNGCIDCRKSKVKCDEIRPFCGTCTRRRHVCQGYATPASTQTAPKTAKQSRRAATAHGRSQRSPTTETAIEDELESRGIQVRTPPSDNSSSKASPSIEQASVARHSFSRFDEPVTTSLSNSTIPKAGHPLIMDPAQLLTLRALCLLPPGVVNPSDEATVEVYFTRHPYELNIGPEFANEMNANVLMVLQNNPQAIVDALSAIGHSYLTSSVSDSSLAVLNYRARILATLRAMGNSKQHSLEDMIVLLLGLCAMELVDSKTTPPQSTIPVVISNAASLINHHVSSGREISSLARYFIRALARQDIIISMVNLRRVMIPTSVWLDEDAQRSADRLMGYTSTLMPLLEELCALAEDVRNLLENAGHHHREEERWNQQQPHQQHEHQLSLLEEPFFSSSSPSDADGGFGRTGLEFLEDEFRMEHGYNTFDEGQFSVDLYDHNTGFQAPILAPTAAEPDLFAEYMKRADDLRARIELWRPRLPHGMAFRRSRRFLSQASCYRSAALLYLFRLFEPPGAASDPDGPSADGEATAKAHEVLMSTNAADGDELKMLLWPLFLAACEMSAEEDRQMVLDMFDAILAQRRTVTAQRTKMFVLNRVWTARDEGRDWNWVTLAKQFPGECMPI